MPSVNEDWMDWEEEAQAKRPEKLKITSLRIILDGYKEWTPDLDEPLIIFRNSKLRTVMNRHQDKSDIWIVLSCLILLQSHVGLFNRCGGCQ